ncbi:hypothetical protein J3R30DRAFT_2285881 [Lentinula aciculospora]|uniref:Uncharacterized protein n=1 Tax=Lentinula aciculospora TaxID=153920 RepID=A0A9W8ZTS9_9AGAR|nr:hypothetical protein J3R30DRAFT_2285881 [Lentinula aciculospora]
MSEREASHLPSFGALNFDSFASMPHAGPGGLVVVPNRDITNQSAGAGMDTIHHLHAKPTAGHSFLNVRCARNFDQPPSSPRHSPYCSPARHRASHSMAHISPTRSRKRASSNVRERSYALPDIMQGIPATIQRHLAESYANTLQRQDGVRDAGYVSEVHGYRHTNHFPVVSQQDPHPVENVSLPPASGPQRARRRRNRPRRTEEILVPFRIPMNSARGLQDICRIACPSGVTEGVVSCGFRYDTADRLIQHLQVEHFDSGSEQDSSRHCVHSCQWQGCQSGVLSVKQDELVDHIIRDHTPFRTRCTRCGVLFEKKVMAVLHLWQSPNGRRGVPGEESWCEYWQRTSATV